MSLLQARRTYIAQQRQTVDKLNKEVNQKLNQVVFSVKLKPWQKLTADTSQRLIILGYEAGHFGRRSWSGGPVVNIC